MSPTPPLDLPVNQPDGMVPPLFNDQKLAHQTAQLTEALTNLLGYRDPESTLLAEQALSGARHLARQYQTRGPAQLHNLLVNLGIKKRGLCCHWTGDLLAMLQELHLEKFRLFWAVSGYATFREHSSIVVSLPEADFSQSIVLDPWRNSGELYWTEVGADRYHWQPHPDYGESAKIHCAGDAVRQ